LHHPGPDPQRGWSRKGAETTSKLRKENLNGGTGDDLRDEKEHFDCGLELEDRMNPGTFAPVLPTPEGQPSELVINISDTFARLTNDYIRAGVHQVSLPFSMRGKRMGSLPDRYSSVFFFKASRETNVGPLPQFVTEDHPTTYKDMTALEFHKEMTKILY
jgi:isopenicillin N synthase-like dioxygenase